MARARSLAEFQKSFPDEESCAAFLIKRRWPDGFACPGRSGEAYPVDSGFPRCSVLSDPIGTVARADIDGEGAVARGIPEVVSRRGELRGIFDQAALAGWFCVCWLWKVPRGWAEKPTSFA